MLRVCPFNSIDLMTLAILAQSFLVAVDSPGGDGLSVA
jgi:hypothetical protein